MEKLTGSVPPVISGADAEDPAGITPDYLSAVSPKVESIGSEISKLAQKPGIAERTGVKRNSIRVSTPPIVDINSAAFDHNAPELWTSWSSYAPLICCINSYPNGVTVSLHTNSVKNNYGGKNNGEKSSRAAAGAANNEGETADSDKLPRKFLPHQFHLRLRDTRDYQVPEGKYFLYRENALRSLEKHLIVLHHKGLLASSTLYFGTASDPFASFHKRFDVTSGCLELFEQYQPGKLVVQTRSPMIISALPLLRRLRERTAVVIPVESHLEKSIARYTPGQPRVAERLVTAEGLRRQGLKVNLSASPVLPYGDFYRDAWDFAEVLAEHSDHVTFGCLASGSEADERQLKVLPIARRIAADKEFRWLRPHAYRYLFHAMSVIAPEKLLLPVTPQKKVAQLDLFAA